MEKNVKQALIDIVGQANFTDALIDLVSYSCDSSDHQHRPDGAVWPLTADQVSKILALANETRFPVVPRGAGTSLTGSAVPIKGGLILDMSRMNRILDIRIPDRLAVVEPGVVYADLERALAPSGFFFPPGPRQWKCLYDRRKCGHQCRRNPGSQIRGNTRLRQGSEDRPAGRTNRALRYGLHEVCLGL